MKLLAFAFLLLFTLQSVAQSGPDWTPLPTPSSGTMLGQATLNGFPCEQGDWVGGFNLSDLCIGAAPLIMGGGVAYIQLALYGDDGTTADLDGLTLGEAFTLRLWDASQDTTYTYEQAIAGWISSNGAPIPGLDNPEAIFAFGGPRQGCTDSNYFEFDPLAEADDGSCSTLIVAGCTDANFLEFTESANLDDGSCNTPAVPGCTNPAYLEFSPAANADDGSCATLIVAGCTDDGYQEFNPAANQDDGSCSTLHILGCTDGSFLEYDPNATQDDGSCTTPTIAGCTDPVACNFNPNANLEEGCFYQTLIRDCNGDCFFDFDGDGVCDSEEISGCRYPAACNFNPDATDDDGSCTFVPEGRDCEGNCLSDADGDGICDPDEIGGCTDPNAINHLSIATDDNGTCSYVSPGCADLNYDGAVSIGDLLIMLTQFGNFCTDLELD